MALFVAIVVCLSPLGLLLGYTVYRAHRIAMIEHMGRQLYNETGGYSPLVEPAPDAFHFNDEVQVTGGLYEGMQGKIKSQVGNEYGVRLEDGSSTWTFDHIHKKHLRLVTTLPQSVSTVIPYVSPYAQDELYEPMEER